MNPAIQCRLCGRFTNKLFIQGQWVRICSCTLLERRSPVSARQRLPRYVQVANLRATGMSLAAIARELNIAPSSAGSALKRAKRRGLL